MIIAILVIMWTIWFLITKVINAIDTNLNPIVSNDRKVKWYKPTKRTNNNIRLTKKVRFKKNINDFNKVNNDINNW